MRKKLVHIIFDLGRGGAETMLVSVLKELKEYDNTVITLFRRNDFENELECDRHICLDLALRNLLVFPFVVRRLRKIFKEIKPDLIHTHLYWPTVLTRLAAPKNVPVVTTIHAFASQLVDFKKWYFRWFERYTYNHRPTTMIAVAQGALQEYYDVLQLKPHKNYVLYTFVDTGIFKPQERETCKVFKVVTVGALRYQKNHLYLLKAFQRLKSYPLQLHIYGSGPLESELKEYCRQNEINNIIWEGQVKNIHAELSAYHLMVMSSFYEGFSLSVLEGMALKLPLLLSDIPSFREQCESTAVYFKLDNPDDFVEKILHVQMRYPEALERAEKALQRVQDNFTLQHHMYKLREIYKEVMDGN